VLLVGAEATQQALGAWRPYQQVAAEHMDTLRAQYGTAGADAVRLLEVAVNASHDAARLQRRPRMWPSMPLRM
jgi:hypothetical protein